MQITVLYVYLVSFSTHEYCSYSDWGIQALPEEGALKKGRQHFWSMALLDESNFAMQVVKETLNRGRYLHDPALCRNTDLGLDAE